MLSSSQDEGVDGGSIRIDALFLTKLPRSEVFFRDSREVQSIAGGWSQRSRLRENDRELPLSQLTKIFHTYLGAQVLFAMTQVHPKSKSCVSSLSQLYFLWRKSSTMLNNVDVFHCYLFLVKWFMVLGLIARPSTFPVGLLAENICQALNSTTHKQSIKARFAFNLCFALCASNLEE